MASYGSSAGCAARIPGINLSALSTPDMTQMETWLAQGAAVIDRALSGAGYAVPVSQSAAVYPELTALNELYAAAHALRARGMDVVVGITETRSDAWLRQFRDQLDDLARSDLVALGVSQATVAGTKHNRIRTTQLRRVDGYSAVLEEGAYTTDALDQ